MKFIEEEKYKSYFGIYRITNTLNGKSYIGQTSESFQRRFWHHRWKLNNNSHDNQYLQNAWNKYGEKNFEFGVVEIIEKDFLDEAEIRQIKKYRQKNLSYNILDGGGGAKGYVRTDEQKRIVGEKNRINNLGRKASDETKRKMSESRKGKPNITSKTVINQEVAREIKTLLIQNVKPKDVANQLDIDYKIVNNILSGNVWSSVQVNGWEEFLSNRKTYSRLKPSDHDEIYRLYKEEGLTKKELALKYGKTEELIRKIIKKREVALINTWQSCAKPTVVGRSNDYPVREYIQGETPCLEVPRSFNEG